ncbi:hypothetical protein EVAR_8796_1 [Eumeta japonica]|uniref:Uncharacterized protein n=1 Tax=Eumeta variegata TaxID=151549 RepID=A0A4C1TTW7_EUMVA|nr:hypothetical protein EVAR_8796_1 [Eumeta japonica]
MCSATIFRRCRRLGLVSFHGGVYLAPNGLTHFRNLIKYIFTRFRRIAPTDKTLIVKIKASTSLTLCEEGPRRLAALTVTLRSPRTPRDAGRRLPHIHLLLPDCVTQEQSDFRAITFSQPNDYCFILAVEDQLDIGEGRASAAHAPRGGRGPVVEIKWTNSSVDLPLKYNARNCHCEGRLRRESASARTARAARAFLETLRMRGPALLYLSYRLIPLFLVMTLNHRTIRPPSTQCGLRPLCRGMSGTGHLEEERHIDYRGRTADATTSHWSESDETEENESIVKLIG